MTDKETGRVQVSIVSAWRDGRRYTQQGDVPWEPLVDYRRAGVSETTIHGAVGWAHGNEVIHQFGGNVLCYGRSMMKPFMMRVFKDVLSI